MGNKIFTGFLKFIVAFLSLLFFSAACQNNLNCTDQIGCINFRPRQPITIAVERVTTGDESNISQSIIEAIKFANYQRPLFLNHPIQFYIQDTPCTQYDHIYNTSLLVSQLDLVGVIGPVCPAGSSDYAKIISDAGLPLLSPVISIDTSNLPGAYDLFPSTQALAESLDSLLSKTTAIKNTDLVVWNGEIAIQFANDFCVLRHAHGYACSTIMLLQAETLDKANLPYEILSQSATLIFILPSSDAVQIPDFSNALNKNHAIFFDPELSAWDKTQDSYSKSRWIVTPHWQADDSISDIFSATSPIDVRSLLAYDAYNMLLRSLSETAEMLPDGKIVVLRQKMQLSFEQVYDFKGLAGMYSCSNRNSCLKTDGFLELRAPNR